MTPERQALYEAIEPVVCSGPRMTNVQARHYANALRVMLRQDAPDNAITIQCRYVLANISHWRHPSAPSVRAALRAWIDAP